MTHASRQSLTIGASLAALLWMAAPANAETASMTISPAEQTARDDERTRILRAELDKEESLLIAATKRKAERQAAGDMSEVEIAEQRRAGHISNITALRRELGVLARDQSAQSASPKPLAVIATRPAANPAAAAGQKSETPWWDVYARSPKRAETAVPPSPLPGRRKVSAAASPPLMR